MAERKLSPQKVLFSTFFAPAAATAEGSLSALPGRMAVAPCTKFSAELREALPPSLRPLLEWELPLAVEGNSWTEGERGTAGPAAAKL